MWIFLIKFGKQVQLYILHKIDIFLFLPETIPFNDVFSKKYAYLDADRKPICIKTQVNLGHRQVKYAEQPSVTCIEGNCV